MDLTYSNFDSNLDSPDSRCILALGFASLASRVVQERVTQFTCQKPFSLRHSGDDFCSHRMHAHTVGKATTQSNFMLLLMIMSCYFFLSFHAHLCIQVHTDLHYIKYVSFSVFLHAFHVYPSIQVHTDSLFILFSPVYTGSHST